MKQEDLEYIFKTQVDEGTAKLYFMLIDGSHRVIERHDDNDMVGLVPMLDNFQYVGTEGRMPRFVK